MEAAMCETLVKYPRLPHRLSLVSKAPIGRVLIGHFCIRAVWNPSTETLGVQATERLHGAREGLKPRRVNPMSGTGMK
jgi:hypothetical protein